MSHSRGYIPHERVRTLVTNQYSGILTSLEQMLQLHREILHHHLTGLLQAHLHNGLLLIGHQLRRLVANLSHRTQRRKMKRAWKKLGLSRTTMTQQLHQCLPPTNSALPRPPYHMRLLRLARRCRQNSIVCACPSLSLPLAFRFPLLLTRPLVQYHGSCPSADVCPTHASVTCNAIQTQVEKGVCLSRTRTRRVLGANGSGFPRVRVKVRVKARAKGVARS